MGNRYQCWSKLVTRKAWIERANGRGILTPLFWRKQWVKTFLTVGPSLRTGRNFESSLKPTSGPCTQAHPRVGRFSSKWREYDQREHADFREVIPHACFWTVSGFALRL